MTGKTISIPDCSDAPVQQIGTMVDALGRAAEAIAFVLDRQKPDFPVGDVLDRLSEELQDIRSDMIETLRERPVLGSQLMQERLNILLAYTVERRDAEAHEIDEVICGVR